MSPDAAPAQALEDDPAARYEVVSRHWQETLVVLRDTRAVTIERWTDRLGTLAREQHELVAAGTWRGGPPTLMAALGLQYRELAVTAGLGWLLRPDGQHRIGARVLDGVLARLGLAASALGSVRVVLEEQREQTRADLVVYGTDFTVVVEAKVFAMEQPEQLERLEAHWAHEPGPVFVFLTRGHRVPTTARPDGAHWHGLSWADVAHVTRRAAEDSPDPAPGVWEYVETLEAYHRG